MSNRTSQRPPQISDSVKPALTLASSMPESGLISSDGDAPKGSQRLRRALVGSDALAILSAWIIAAAVSPGTTDEPLLSVSHLGFVPVMLAITLALFATNKLYKARVCSIRAVETASILRACALGSIGGWLIAGRLTQLELTTSRLIIGQTLAFLFVIAGRTLYRGALKRARRSGKFARPVIIVGTGDEAYELQRLLVDEPELGYSVLGVIGKSHEAAERSFSVPFLGATHDSVKIVQDHGASGVIIGASSLSFRELNHVVRMLLDAGIHVQVSGGLLGFNASRLRANPIGREAAFYLEQVQLTGWQSRVKRCLDIVLAIFGLIIFSPVIAFFALWVKRTDGGPAFFKQQRIGRDGEPFTMIKLRTMCVDAEAKLAALMAKNERSGPLFKMDDDPRFTRVGKIMDATSINELPQFWNVIRGEMSLVGPRPALPREVAKFNDRLLLRHRVKPGITGLWQVESRDDPSFADYERCDVFYVENWSVRLDLMIIAQTFVEVFRRAANKGAKKEEQKHLSVVSSGEPESNTALANQPNEQKESSSSVGAPQQVRPVRNRQPNPGSLAGNASGQSEDPVLQDAATGSTSSSRTTA